MEIIETAPTKNSKMKNILIYFFLPIESSIYINSPVIKAAVKPATSGISVAFSIKMSPLIMSLPILPISEEQP